jgi:Flp pilus assembly protein TadD
VYNFYDMSRQAKARCKGPGLARFIAAGALAWWLAACGTVPVGPRALPEFRGAGPAVEIPEANILALSPDMQAFLDRYILPYEDPDTRLHLLGLAVGRSGVPGFSYDDDRTLTAAAAFAAGAGNCLSFANMLVALARHAGLEAQYQEVLVQREWTSHEDTVLLAKHINVIVRGKHFRYVVDITGQRPDPAASQRILTDAEARALFYNNMGVNALLDRDLARAWAYIAKAIGTAPRMASPWVNLGVVMSRNGQLQDAAYAHRTALDIDPRETAALSNLYDTYLARGDERSAGQVRSRVESYRRQNPYYLLKLSDEAIAATRYQDSMDLLKRAISKKSDEHLLHFALAKTQYLAGERAAAEDSYQRARQLAPDTALARYERSLPELIEESAAAPR